MHALAHTVRNPVFLQFLFDTDSALGPMHYLPLSRIRRLSFFFCRGLLMIYIAISFLSIYVALSYFTFVWKISSINLPQASQWIYIIVHDSSPCCLSCSMSLYMGTKLYMKDTCQSIRFHYVVYLYLMCLCLCLFGVLFILIK